MRRLDAQRLLLLVFLGVMVVAAAVATAQPHNLDTDIWWHLANGRYILDHGLPSTDVYSFTATGHVWVVHEWLADVAVYVLYGRAGVSGLIVLAALAVAGGEFFVFRLLGKGGLGTTSAVVVAVLLAVASAPSWGPRPQLLNFLFVGLLVLALLRYRRRPGPGLFWLVPMFIAWANLHSGFVVGVGLLLLFFAGELAQAGSRRLSATRAEAAPILQPADLRRLLAVTLMALLAGLLTPGTYRTLEFAFSTLTSQRIQGLIAEWSSPDFHTLSGQALMVVVLLMIAGAAGIGRSDAKVDLTYLLLGLGGLALGLTSQRHVPIFAACAAPLVGQLVASLLAGLGARPRTARRVSAGMAQVNLGILVGLAAVGALYAWQAVSPVAVDRAVTASAPVAATDYLLAARPPGQLFNFYNYGGYLDWKAYPTYRVFIDGRTEVFGDDIFDQYLKVEYLSPDFESTLDHYRVKTVLISAGDPLRLLLESHGWRVAHSDPIALVYVRAGT